ncbi:MAG: Hsp70 family protein [Gloeocapsa sp. DLM2.Bin57]|nr:MAG: Hsp70 family protein [Gloeocapsa sp. DLM2.Bin57]
MYLGIDFGTCYSTAALLLEAKLTPIPEPFTQGYTFPSSVFITATGEILVGQEAENNRQTNLQRYKREFKRDLGTPEPYILGEISLLPEELVTEIIKKIKTEAEKITQVKGIKNLYQAVITVPATYNKYQRKLMEQAAHQAGFTEIKLLEEPIAAATYYFHNTQIKQEDIILVYDLGGGTFDATLLQKKKTGYKILGIPKSLNYCGVLNFDNLIFDYLKDNCSQQLREYLESQNTNIISLCQQLKHQLSENQEGTINLQIGLEEAETFSLTRKQFEEMLDPIITESVDCCEQLVKNAGLNWSRINHILIVGSSSLIPNLKRLLELRLEHDIVTVDNLDFVVSFGAAIFGQTAINSQTTYYNWQTDLTRDIQTKFNSQNKSKRSLPIPAKQNQPQYNISLATEIQKLFDKE